MLSERGGGALQRISEWVGGGGGGGATFSPRMFDEWEGGVPLPKISDGRKGEQLSPKNI